VKSRVHPVVKTHRLTVVIISVCFRMFRSFTGTGKTGTSFPKTLHDVTADTSFLEAIVYGQVASIILILYQLNPEKAVSR
jgi:hypothetical protein